MGEPEPEGEVDDVRPRRFESLCPDVARPRDPPPDSVRPRRGDSPFDPLRPRDSLSAADPERTRELLSADAVRERGGEVIE